MNWDLCIENLFKKGILFRIINHIHSLPNNLTSLPLFIPQFAFLSHFSYFQNQFYQNNRCFSLTEFLIFPLFWPLRLCPGRLFRRDGWGLAGYSSAAYTSHFSFFLIYESLKTTRTNSRETLIRELPAKLDLLCCFLTFFTFLFIKFIRI